MHSNTSCVATMTTSQPGGTPRDTVGTHLFEITEMQIEHFILNGEQQDVPELFTCGNFVFF